MRNAFVLFSILAAAVLPLAGCAGPSGSPIDELKAYYKDIPTYSVILDDMKAEGTFFTSHYHQYQVVVPPPAGASGQDSSESAQTEIKSFTTEWLEVSSEQYKKFENMLGMTVYSKAEGRESTTPGPPGYEYVGDKRYGRWQTDSSGASFWVFYGQYRLFSDLIGLGRVNRYHYNDYRRDQGLGRPYYGPGAGYGTAGKITQNRHRSFYERRMAKQKSTFARKVGNRAGRTRTGYRGRSGGVGK